jgi:hypothetical protein
MLEIRIRPPRVQELAAFESARSAEPPVKPESAIDRLVPAILIPLACGLVGGAAAVGLVVVPRVTSPRTVDAVIVGAIVLSVALGIVFVRRKVLVGPRRERPPRPEGPTVAQVRVEASRVALVAATPEYGRAYAFEVADGAFVYVGGPWLDDPSKFEGGEEAMSRFPSRVFTLVVTRVFREVLRVDVEGDRVVPDAEIPGDRATLVPVTDVEIVLGRIDGLTDGEAEFSRIEGRLSAGTAADLLAAPAA